MMERAPINLSHSKKNEAGNVVPTPSVFVPFRVWSGLDKDAEPRGREVGDEPVYDTG